MKETKDISIFSKADYIGAPKWEEPNMPVFRREFRLDKAISKASVVICGLGNFALYVNGIWVNEGVIEPGWTNYKKTCFYSRYDISRCVHHGKNEITVLLGNGMYRVVGGRYTKFKNSFGDLMLIARCEIDYADGTGEEIITDDQWLVAKGPIVFSCVYGGEDFDARIQNWKNAVDTYKEDWMRVVLKEGPAGQLKPVSQPEVSVRRKATPVRVRHIAPHVAVYDFGRNFAGRPVIQVTGEIGESVRITPGELLNPDGTVNQSFSGSPHYYTYILGGNKTECWMPYFTYYGFRYLEIRGEANILDVSGAETFAAVPVKGGFSCSNELFNQIHVLIVRAMESNMQSVFTDCPHREKLGWLEQLQLIGPGLIYNFDIKQTALKILNDMSEAQLKNGLVPNIAPEYVAFDGAFRDSPEWGSACIILPWYIYESYGDISILKKHYAMMKCYLKYLLSKSEHFLLSYGLGDWMDVGHIGGASRHTPMPVTASAILYYDLSLMEKIAAMLKKTEDQDEFAIWKSKCRDAFNENLLHQEGFYASGSQTSNAMPLFLDIVPEQYRKAVLKHLVEDIRNKGNHATGGDVGHPFIIRSLAKEGRSDVVEDMFENMDSPGYGFQIANRATTLCEDWDGPAAGREHYSQNHFMLGAAEEWFYRYLAGIRVQMDLDEKEVIFKPYLAKNVDWVNCWTDTPCGKAEILWQKENRKAIVSCHVPEGLKAELYLPGNSQPVVFRNHITESVPLT